MGAHPTWTLDMSNRAKAALDDGASYAQVGLIVGKTRGAVAGHAQRQGWQATREPGGPVAAKPERKTPFRPKPQSAPSLKPAPLRAIVYRPAGPPKHMFDLASDDCRWPAWGDADRPSMLFCGGGAVEGLPYCLAHCRMAYRMRGSSRFLPFTGLPAPYSSP